LLAGKHTVEPLSIGGGWNACPDVTRGHLPVNAGARVMTEVLTLNDSFDDVVFKHRRALSRAGPRFVARR
jgi:hypothetical protein